MKRLIAMVVSISLLMAVVSGVPAAASTVIEVWPGQSIQAAVDQADPGDVVLVHVGIYDQEVRFNTGDNGITLRGEEGTVLQKTDEPSMDFTAIAISAGVSGVTIEGFNIRNYRFGVLLEPGSTGNIIRRNRVSGCWDGINLVNAPGNHILQNTVTGSIWAGIWLGPNCDEWGNPFGPGSDSNHIINNSVSGCDGGIIIDHSNGNQVMENKVKDSVGPGIFVGHDSESNWITGNDISGCNDGINLGNARYNNVLDNKILGSAGAGIFLGPDGTEVSPDNNVIGGNKVSSCRAGIVLFIACNNDVLQNRVSGCEKLGIAATGPDSGPLSAGNLIQDNMAMGTRGFDLFDKSLGVLNDWLDNKYRTSNF